MSGETIFKEAERKLNKWFFVDYSEAMELFEKAASRFKVEKNYSRAADAFMRAHQCALKSNDSYASSAALANCVAMYKKFDMKKAETLLDMAVRAQIDNSKLREAAKLEKEFAESLYEDGRGMEAVEHFNKAKRYFSAEDMNSQAKNCDVAVAKIYGENDEFDKAISLYERLGRESVNGPLRHEAKEFYMRAMLCRLATISNANCLEGSLEASEALKTYMQSDAQLSNTREGEFLVLCSEAVESRDIDKFDVAVSLLQELRMLDDWKTHVLLVIKKNFESIL
ncbi:putative soluble N ethylmaleimide sensitive factor (NSF) attachment protein [Trypanosoma vivax]|uniref:Putative soluble N-ethylmaleimide sensitive factor (NSF) attachment protein n=1 Tax=Trypanosoma vivax (strain Y486) TaxID=1055687 RepID=G0TRC7_TRYVY|nr:putative soluble N-ethylmaleimide sensitive factor (NSF) attachment protein [Trypanosoma vivax]KAH8612504.1 putative soluble N ethylmaleimide sensitive factor (NSF) attachment protein [Trypanosoma vivax]CCC46491.1 putative soluble N-ethylmaleimide sensitive factor (NSF) attachment protein, fragment [Trypanosoma vivax Y486]